MNFLKILHNLEDLNLHEENSVDDLQCWQLCNSAAEDSLEMLALNNVILFPGSLKIHVIPIYLLEITMNYPRLYSNITMGVINFQNSRKIDLESSAIVVKWTFALKPEFHL